jgi:hypothetical protein
MLSRLRAFNLTIGTALSINQLRRGIGAQDWMNTRPRAPLSTDSQSNITQFFIPPIFKSQCHKLRTFSERDTSFHEDIGCLPRQQDGARPDRFQLRVFQPRTSSSHRVLRPSEQLDFDGPDPASRLWCRRSLLAKKGTGRLT